MSVPLKTAILPSAFYPSLGGVEELVRQLSHQLHLRGRAPVVIANRWPRSLPVHEQFEKVELYRAPFRVPCGSFRAKLNYWLTHSIIRRKVMRILRRHAVDLIHVQCVSGATFYALHAKRRLGLPLVVTLQGELTMDADRVFERDAFTREVLRTALREADVITGCSAKTLADAEQFYGNSFGDRARVIFNGASLDDFRNGLAYAHPRPYVLALGRLVQQKGFDTLLRAFAAAKLPGWDLIVAGDGTDRAGLQKLAGELSLRESVHFFGRADRTQAASLFRGCEFVAIPSRADEGLPVVIAEAMAAGKPVLGTRVGGVPEAVLEGETGLLVEREDVSAMAAGLKRLAADNELRMRMAAAAARRSEIFAWPAIADQYEAAYEEARRRCSSAGLPQSDSLYPVLRGEG
jgi:glycogen(starch) synthase